MQRRAAAVSAAVFLLIAAGSFALIGAAQQPDVEIEAAHELSNGSQVEINGTQFNVSVSGGSANITWINESQRHTAALENGSNITYQNGTYTVQIESAQDPSAFTLVEVQNATRIIRQDPDVYNRTFTDEEGTQYVRYRSNGSLVPLDTYLPTPERAQFSEGGEFPHENRTTTITAVDNQTVTLEWRADTLQFVQPSEGGNVTLAGEKFVAHYEGDTLLLSTNFEAYQAERDAQTYFKERMSGLWGVIILSTLTAVLLAMLAYLPSRY